MSHYFLCSQNKDSINNRFIQFLISDFVAAEFSKTPSPKPARIPPQTPPAGGKSAEAGRIRNPRQIVSPCRVRIVSVSFVGIFCKMGSDFFKQTPPFRICRRSCLGASPLGIGFRQEIPGGFEFRQKNSRRKSAVRADGNKKISHP